MARGRQADDRAGGLVFASHDACIHTNMAVFVQHRAKARVKQRFVFHRFNSKGDRFQGVQNAGLQAFAEVVEQRFHAGHALGVSIGHAAPRTIATCTTVHGEDDHALTSLKNGAADDLLWRFGTVAVVCSNIFDGSHNVHALDDLTENRMRGWRPCVPPVKEIVVLGVDEKL